MQIVEAPTNHQIKISATEIKLTRRFVDEWEKLLARQKPHQVKISGHHFQESTNQELSNYKCKESYYYHGPS